MPSIRQPAYFWCYADEDLVGQMIEIGENCHIITLAITVLTKWLVCAFDVDSDEEDWENEEEQEDFM